MPDGGPSGRRPVDSCATSSPILSGVERTPGGTVPLCSVGKGPSTTGVHVLFPGVVDPVPLRSPSPVKSVRVPLFSGQPCPTVSVKGLTHRVQCLYLKSDKTLESVIVEPPTGWVAGTPVKGNRPRVTATQESPGLPPRLWDHRRRVPWLGPRSWGGSTGVDGISKGTPERTFAVECPLLRSRTPPCESGARLISPWSPLTLHAPPTTNPPLVTSGPVTVPWISQGPGSYVGGLPLHRPSPVLSSGVSRSTILRV